MRKKNVSRDVLIECIKKNVVITTVNGKVHKHTDIRKVAETLGMKLPSATMRISALRTEIYAAVLKEQVEKFKARKKKMPTEQELTKFKAKAKSLTIPQARKKAGLQNGKKYVVDFVNWMAKLGK